MKRTSLILVFLFAAIAGRSTDHYPKNEAIDVKHYHFFLEVNDSTNVIYGEASLSIFFKKSISIFSIDLATKDDKGKGMSVSEVSVNGLKLLYTHGNSKLKITLPSAAKANTTLTFKIVYRGEPIDGLVIGKNKFGDRGFFGDNWPDRAHHWLPVVDHPFDKSSVDFSVVAPMHYSVIANGVRVEESFLSEKRKLTRYHEEIPIPVKVMVVGIARFAMEVSGKVQGIPVESWVYPQNKSEGFFDYSVSAKVLDFFHTHIGEYSYKKLANVQSKTRFGGLENASAIFYFENSVTGKGNIEGLIAHETAHQWFGNSATERDWHHVWLSEGFATYFANLYLENAYGHDRLAEEEKKDRDQVVGYFAKNPAAVLDTTITDLMKLLSVNAYQKGGWVLHMLRHELGDQNFWKGIRTYYATYRNSNALTSDFEQIMEQASGADLSWFFNQWIYKAGHPKIVATWQYDQNAKTLSMEVTQAQTGSLFRFPLDIGVGAEVKTVAIDKKTQTFSFPMAEKPAQIGLDPNIWLLFEGSITEKKP
ncbi:MAG TPA: M1 family aminopeptidase [Cyclobacteriaceae bacterium]|jgi:aminopeptidase N|nr:M1 family aminopeptidase [Cyclobacteriaceae bacterium]